MSPAGKFPDPPFLPVGQECVGVAAENRLSARPLCGLKIGALCHSPGGFPLIDADGGVGKQIDASARRSEDNVFASIIVFSDSWP